MTINAAPKPLTIAASADGRLWSEYPTGNAPTTPGTRNVLYTGTFDDGLIAANGQLVNGGFISALRDTGYVNGSSVFPSGGAGNYGPSIDSDLRLAASEVVGGETINPRKGGYFLRGAMYYNKTQFNSFPPGYYKDYNALSGGAVGSIYGSSDKPRWSIGYSNAAYLTDFDREWWMGLSIRLPLNWSHDDPLASNKSANMFFTMTSQDADRTQFNLSVRARQLGVSSDWVLDLQTNATSTDENVAGGAQDLIALSGCDADLGVWTDFVIRARMNPFSVPTNANTVSGGRNQVFPGNTGILEIWKSLGAGRVMTKVFTRVNVPVGLVPPVAVLEFSIRNYKYGWKKIPTQAATPVWMGFDEIRFGETITHGTSFSDVDVDQRAMP